MKKMYPPGTQEDAEFEKGGGRRRKKQLENVHQTV